MTRRLAPWLLATPALVLLGALLLVPLLLLLRISLYASSHGAGFYEDGTWSLSAYREVLGSSHGRGVIGFTVLFSVAVAGICLLVAYPLSLGIHHLPRRLKVVALGIVLLPKLANVFVVCYGINLLLGHSGPVNTALIALGLVAEPLRFTNSLFGVLVAEVYVIMPYAVLILVPTFDRIDPSLLAAARGLGASRWVAFRRVTWPLSLPGTVVAGELGLIWAFGAFVGPVMLGGPDQTTLAVLVPRYALEYTDFPKGAAVAVLNILVLACCLAVLVGPARRLKRAQGHD